MKDIEIKLSNYVRWAELSLVSSLLDKYKDLDLTYDEGKCFALAIDNKSIDIIKTLLNYFEQNQLSKHEEGSYEYLHLRQKMLNTIRRAVEDLELSEDMKMVLDKYLPQEDNDSDQDISDLNVDNFHEDDHSTRGNTPPEKDIHEEYKLNNYLTYANLQKLDQEYNVSHNNVVGDDSHYHNVHLIGQH